jgi:hypothetical protein
MQARRMEHLATVQAQQSNAAMNAAMQQFQRNMQTAVPPPSAR